VTGIRGMVDFDGVTVRPDVLQNMAEAAAHREPDGIRYWRDGPVRLANLALNVTPESLRELQLLISRRGNQCSLAYNCRPADG